ncbi:hypothetical protein ISF_02195 [Cordyceps fumosorosea ARSEF 2679]|uniref:Uncharacterized protein n=1 Tax=Cordyceps fumosorosea (strain ARSEF 2679) TaxID=1081104 RepID=A0A162LJY5_CORFA|nr:hypothetical protein ISF_02195 [Cordyceps fumosorosea ARSEF 2679]OAA71644.1 hypothetical protein ISF_02195 [Cordyceps fumosorosea ARSEF 2679]
MMPLRPPPDAEDMLTLRIPKDPDERSPSSLAAAGASAGGMFEAADLQDHALRSHGELLATSLHRDGARSHHGLVHAAFRAHHARQHLALRPEDLWLAVLAQVGVWLRAHPDARRRILPNHHHHLLPARCGRRAAPRALASRMVGLLESSCGGDAGLPGWVVPAFSCTTGEDRAVAAALFLGTTGLALATADALRRRTVTTTTRDTILASLFRGPMQECRALPPPHDDDDGLFAVTLHGKRADYVAIQQRLDLLPQHLGPRADLALLVTLLRPVVRHFVLTFKEGGTPRVRAFWRRIVTADAERTGRRNLTGWITAFCCLPADGGEPRSRPGRPEYFLDGVGYPSVPVLSVPPGAAAVPVVMGDDEEGQVECTLVAGSMAIHDEAGATMAERIFRPAPGWALYVNKNQS